MSSITNAQAIINADSAVDSLDVGTTDATADIVFYDGTPPANVDTALSGNNVLGTITFANPAFGAAADIAPGARATAGTITGANASAGGTCTFSRFRDRDNASKVQCTVSAIGGGGEIQFNTNVFVNGAALAISALTYTVPEI